MTGRRPWWPLLLGYTGLLWALVLGVCALVAVLPDGFSYTDVVPLEAIVLNSLWTVGPALATAALAMTAATLAIGLVRAGRGSAAVDGDQEDDDVELGEGVLVELLPAGGDRRRS
ncbi:MULTISPECIES: hypothetical protein [Rathayibacter]|uniref:Uncharacterized protein n=1 Tax=Rathayibacter festucae DSM 15932 TaxID=1328866 RepID=A0A3Q9UZJ1_9MICO|nr:MULTISPECIES: hypothetical protein [Rathayibacter]AZZ52900.1 hypothetical protein C1I64_13215 [Rathayibacter festucae DSM 15932]ROQ04303.1 hypothetical protein EDF54_2506 [Rathayibacter sp. PhB93]TDQ13140.1 hypothetical protein EDF17_1741 [Rathayibacter sp. PhB1]